MLSRSYSTAVNGLKVSTSNSEGYLSKLIVKVNAGSRYAEKDGLSHVLSRFNYQNTHKKSALRFAREAELLGGFYNSSVTRDSILLSATFQKQDLPYFVNSLADVVAQTEYKIHELTETVLPAVKHDYSTASSCPEYQALEALHAATFRNGLAKPLLYDNIAKISLEDVKTYASKAFTKSNIEIIGSGIEESALGKFVNESALYDLAEGSKLTDPVKQTAQEVRVRSTAGNAAAIGAAIKPEEFGLYETVATYLIENFDVKAAVHKYSDVGLFSVVASGDSAPTVAATIKSISSALKSGVQISDYAELTKTKLAVAGESAPHTQIPTVSNVNDFSLGKFSYVALGNTSELPYAEEL